MAPKDLPVLILGGGAWGLSTTLHMLNSGYTDITVIERAEQIPSRYSAAWDLNKIVRAEYEDAFYTGLALVSSSFTFLMSRRPKYAIPSNFNYLKQCRLFKLSLTDEDVERG